jgi:hypothetical protein
MLWLVHNDYFGWKFAYVKTEKEIGNMWQDHRKKNIVLQKSSNTIANKF